MAEILQPHLVRAYLNSAAVTRLLDQPCATTGALESLEPAVVVLDAEGHPVHVGDRAAELAALYLPDDRRSGSLPDALCRWLAGAVAGRREPTAQVVTPRSFVVSGSQADLVVHLTTGLENHYLAFVEERARPAPLRVLTPRQQKIFALVRVGLSDKEVARNLGISVRTVHKLPERIYRVLGVHSRSAAIASITAHYDPPSGSGSLGTPL